MAKIEELNEKQLEAVREAMLMAGLEDDDATIEEALTEDGINTPLVFMERRGNIWQRLHLIRKIFANIVQSVLRSSR